MCFRCCHIPRQLLTKVSIQRNSQHIHDTIEQPLYRFKPTLSVALQGGDASVVAGTGIAVGAWDDDVAEFEQPACVWWVRCVLCCVVLGGDCVVLCCTGWFCAQCSSNMHNAVSQYTPKCLIACTPTHTTLTTSTSPQRQWCIFIRSQRLEHPWQQRTPHHLKLRRRWIPHPHHGSLVYPQAGEIIVPGDEGPCEHLGPTSHCHLSTDRIRELIDGEFAAGGDVCWECAGDVVVAMGNCDILCRVWCVCVVVVVGVIICLYYMCVLCCLYVCIMYTCVYPMHTYPTSMNMLSLQKN